jgi:hypothetical protein
MNIFIDSIDLKQDEYEVRATFTEGDHVTQRSNTFRGQTKEVVERWLREQAEGISNMLFVNTTLEKEYVFTAATGLKTKKASLIDEKVQ